MSVRHSGALSSVSLPYRLCLYVFSCQSVWGDQGYSSSMTEAPGFMSYEVMAMVKPQ